MVVKVCLCKEWGSKWGKSVVRILIEIFSEKGITKPRRLNKILQKDTQFDLFAR